MRKLSITLVMLSCAALLAVGCKKKSETSEGPAESAGEEVDQAGEKAGDAVEEAGDKVEDAADEAS